MLPTPSYNIPSADGRERLADGLRRLFPDGRTQGEELRRHTALTVDALQLFVLAKERFQNFAAADQPLARMRLSRLVSDEGQRHRGTIVTRVTPIALHS